MPRPTRKRLKFDEESLNKLLQEIYDDTFNIRARIARLFTKWEIKVKEGGEIQAIGDQIVKLIAAEAKNQDQKLVLLKILNDVINSNKTNGVSPSSSTGKSEGSESISSDARLELLNFVQEELEKKQKNKEQ
jgi:hypothetical protein